jgi:hypothetical protein
LTIISWTSEEPAFARLAGSSRPPPASSHAFFRGLFCVGLFCVDLFCVDLFCVDQFCVDPFCVEQITDALR